MIFPLTPIQPNIKNAMKSHHIPIMHPGPMTLSSHQGPSAPMARSSSAKARPSDAIGAESRGRCGVELRRSGDGARNMVI